MKGSQEGRVVIKEKKRKVSSWGAFVLRGLSRPLLASELHDHCRSCCESVWLAGIIGIAVRFSAFVLFFSVLPFPVPIAYRWPASR